MGSSTEKDETKVWSEGQTFKELWCEDVKGKEGSVKAE